MSTLNSRDQEERTTYWGPFLCVLWVTGSLGSRIHEGHRLSERREELKSANRWFLCLNRCHNGSVCSKRGRALCTSWKRAHHRSIYNETGAVTSPTKETAPTTVGKIDVASPDFTYFQTARIWIMGPTGLSKLTRFVLDAGSQSSFFAKCSLGSNTSWVNNLFQYIRSWFSKDLFTIYNHRETQLVNALNYFQN